MNIIVEVTDLHVPIAELNPEDFSPHRRPITMQVRLSTPNGVSPAMDQIASGELNLPMLIGNAVTEAIKMKMEENEVAVEEEHPDLGAFHDLT